MIAVNPNTQDEIETTLNTTTKEATKEKFMKESVSATPIRLMNPSDLPSKTVDSSSTPALHSPSKLSNHKYNTISVHERKNLTIGS